MFLLPQTLAEAEEATRPLPIFYSIIFEKETRYELNFPCRCITYVPWYIKATSDAIKEINEYRGIVRFDRQPASHGFNTINPAKNKCIADNDRYYTMLLMWHVKLLLVF